jgi:hypothetical protein
MTSLNRSTTYHKERKMATLFVPHKVQDYRTWRRIFDDLTAIRTGYGCTGHKVFQAPNDPNEITISCHARMPTSGSMAI